MARIFLAFAQSDEDTIEPLTTGLSARGHEIVHDFTIFGGDPGSWRARLGPTLRSCDVFMPVFSHDSKDSPIFLSEVEAAKSYSSSSGRMTIIGISIDDSPAGVDLAGTVYFKYDRLKIDEILANIDASIARFMGRLLASEQKAAETVERVEANIAEYLDEAVVSQRKSEKKNWYFGTFWYALGFVALLGGVLAAFGATSAHQTADTTTIDLVGSIAKSIVLVGFLGACARYAFVLGKSYINESLKNADRLHAMQFGRFYLRVFGDKTNWQELKEVFANWNISNNSSFSNLSASDIDPKLVDLVAAMMKSTHPGEKVRDGK